MGFYKFLKHENSYLPNRDNDEFLGLLGTFLISDVGSDDDNNYRAWALDEKRDQYGGNIVYLEKKDNKIILGDDFSLDEDEPFELEMTTEQFIYIINSWIDLQKKQYNQIIITRDESTNIITLSGNNIYLIDQSKPLKKYRKH